MALAERYRFLGRLGAGGMAEVLEAEILGASGFVRRVAVKRMLSSAAEDPAFVRMFLDEARIASHLHHANIVGVIDYGVVEGAPFQVLELVDGLDARTMLRRAPDGRLPAEVALHLAVQVGHALAAAHAARDVAGTLLGIVHRDVSPANILVSWGGDVKLADFGIAFAKDRSEKTETGMMKGTLLFMSPEQATGGGVDPRSDLFSLGCVLHMLLTGASPLAGDGFQRFLRTGRAELDPSLPIDLRAIIERATAYDRGARYTDAAQMTEAIGEALARRTKRDPRLVLVEHLAPLRAARRAPSPLDELFRIDLVVPAEKTTTGTSLRTAILERTPAGEPAARESTRHLPIAVVPPAPSHAPIAVSVAAILVVAAIGAIGFGASRWARASSHQTETPPPSLAASAAPPPSAIASVEPPASVVAVAPAAPVAAPVVAPTSRPAVAPPTPPKPSAAATVEPECSGTVFLSCPGAPRVAVDLDAKTSSHHHGEFVDLPCGRHLVTFHTDAARPVTVTLGTVHTRTAPLEVRCPDP